MKYIPSASLDPGSVTQPSVWIENTLISLCGGKWSPGAEGVNVHELKQLSANSHRKFQTEMFMLLHKWPQFHLCFIFFSSISTREDVFFQQYLTNKEMKGSLFLILSNRLFPSWWTWVGLNHICCIISLVRRLVMQMKSKKFPQSRKLLNIQY